MEVVRAPFPARNSSTGSTRSSCSTGSAAEHMAPIVDIQVARVQQAAQGPQDRARPDRRRRAPGSGRVGYDPVYGARPLKRAVQQYLQDPLADAILRGDIPDGQTVKVDEGDGALKLTV